MDSQHNTDLQLLLKLNKHQLSDLGFLNDEVRFLKSLLNRYFLSMISDSYINRIQLINNHLTQLSMLKANVTDAVLVHQGAINSIINGLQSKSIDLLKLESERMDEEIKEINKSFRNIKKEIFAVYKDSQTTESQKSNALS